ncbi:Bug family tripartite tricarboxylate transporter substrate binding protein [Noviherbaspirillum denitrificans]|uniref:Bug family tripartite tricarboxylate transporter substrate binding protein n=1 Tax=Noviherbaspirillum denitrificans TaxID=1968433 RepID=UPI001F188718|nr:tripartite tricarboxylate transporter substrate binding protein [Noviherbaspirillum denitrificans]
MKPHTSWRRQFVRVLACSGILLFGSPAVHAAYPEKPVILIVPFPAGGPTDVLARLVGQQISQAFNQPVIVENRGGAGGTIATSAAAQSAPDGYTLFLATTGTMAINPSLYRSFRVDPMKAFEPIGSIASTNNVLVVPANSPVSNLKDLIGLARSKPGVLTFGSAGNGSSSHISGELLKTMAGINVVHVPYKGAAPAFTDLLGGQLSMMFDTVSSQVQYLGAGKVKALGVTGRKRSEALPNVPTIEEAGVPGFEVQIWFGLAAPRGTPDDVVKKLNQQLQKIISAPETKAKFASIGVDPLPGNPADFAAMIQKDTAKWSKVVKESGATID